MPQLVIEVDEDLNRRLSDRVTRAGLADAADLIRALLARELDVADDGDAIDPATLGGPPHLAVADDPAALERLLLSRLDGGPSIPATPEFWADLRRQIAQRAAADGTA